VIGYNRYKRLNNGDMIECHYYFPLRTIYGQSSRDSIQAAAHRPRMINRYALQVRESIIVNKAR